MKNATQIIVSMFGTFMGLAGIEHGIGEILQGSTRPAEIMILSWPKSKFFASVSGEPAMTIIPNLLITGILAILFSTIYIAWATLLVHKKDSGRALILSSIAMLLAGGGIFPPVLGFMIGVLRTRVNHSPSPRRTRLSDGLQKFLSKYWPLSLAASLIAWLMLFPGINFLGFFLGVNDAILTTVVIALAFGTLFLTIFWGLVSDRVRKVDG
jgi:hypothetical protein